MVGSVDVYKVELHDLQSLLRKNLDKNLVVIKYTVDPLLPAGENYGSTILKVHAVIEKNGKEEELDLVAKMLPPTDFQRSLFDSSYTFKKEIFLYEKIQPTYQNLERELGIEEKNIFDILPKFYGSRFSRKSDDEIDEDAVILMENLKTLGYYTLNRFEGMDYQHSRAAIKALARFHALGIALKRHKPDFFSTVKKWCKCMTLIMNDCSRDSFLNIFRNDSELSKHYECLKDVISYDLSDRWMKDSTEPWSTVINNDLWLNNMMFRKDEKTNEVKNVKFVDFQNYLLMSPLRELIFFVFTCFNYEVMDNHFDELIDLYHSAFISHLKYMNCDVADFSKNKFEERLKIDAYEEFIHIPFMLKVITKDTEGKTMSDLQNILGEEEVNPILLVRLRKIVRKYVEKGWFRSTN